ncbi:MAG TPA: type IV pilus assembly protein PilM [Acidimicrobiales bacterium]|nr:type IV pilus assembly protein PilM [Acidimicrobiales bacterium]
MDTSIGLDIGASAVRAVEIELERNQRRLRRFGQVGLPPGAVADGEILKPSVVAEGLRRLWDEVGFASRKVVIGVSGHRLFVRQADVPALNEADLRSALQFDAQELIPIPMEDASFDFRILDRDDSVAEDGRSTMRILVVAAHREMIRPYIDALAEANLELVAIDAAPLALMRVVPPGDGLEALVSIGAELTTIAVRQGGVPGFIRSLGIGGEKLTSGLAGAMHLEHAVAESLKRGVAQESSPQFAQARKAMARDIRDVGEDVRATIDFFLSQSNGARIESLLVTGGASMTAGLVEELAGDMDVDIRRIDPFATLTLGDVGLSPEMLNRARATSATAVGLALWAADPPNVRLSVLPKDVEEARKARRKTRLAIAGVAGLAGLLLLGGAGEMAAAHAARSQAEATQRHVSELQSQVARLQAETSVHAKVLKRQGDLRTALHGDIDWVRVLKEIQAATPPGLQIQNLSGNRPASGPGSSASAGAGSLTFSVSGTGGLPAAASWLESLQKDLSVQGTWVSTISTGNGSTVTFSSTTNLTTHAYSNRDQAVSK